MLSNISSTFYALSQLPVLQNLFVKVTLTKVKETTQTCLLNLLRDL
jgi:hypothetical protein